MKTLDQAGTGVLYIPEGSQYVYILTVAHLFHRDSELEISEKTYVVKFDFSEDDIVFDSGRNLVICKDYTPSALVKDAAVLIIKKTCLSEERQSLPVYSCADKYDLEQSGGDIELFVDGFGFPDIAEENEVRPIRLRYHGQLASNDEIICSYVNGVSEYTENWRGYSGSGMFGADGRLYGLFCRYPDGEDSTIVKLTPSWVYADMISNISIAQGRLYIPPCCILKSGERKDLFLVLKDFIASDTEYLKIVEGPFGTGKTTAAMQFVLPYKEQVEIVDRNRVVEVLNDLSDHQNKLFIVDEDSDSFNVEDAGDVSRLASWLEAIHSAGTRLKKACVHIMIFCRNNFFYDLDTDDRRLFLDEYVITIPYQSFSDQKLREVITLHIEKTERRERLFPILSAIPISHVPYWLNQLLQSEEWEEDGSDCELQRYKVYDFLFGGHVFEYFEGGSGKIRKGIPCKSLKIKDIRLLEANVKLQAFNASLAREISYYQWEKIGDEEQRKLFVACLSIFCFETARQHGDILVFMDEVARDYFAAYYIYDKILSSFNGNSPPDNKREAVGEVISILFPRRGETLVPERVRNFLMYILSFSSPEGDSAFILDVLEAYFKECMEEGKAEYEKFRNYLNPIKKYDVSELRGDKNVNYSREEFHQEIAWIESWTVNVLSRLDRNDLAEVRRIREILNNIHLEVKDYDVEETKSKTLKRIKTKNSDMHE